MCKYNRFQYSPSDSSRLSFGIGLGLRLCPTRAVDPLLAAQLGAVRCADIWMQAAAFSHFLPWLLPKKLRRCDDFNYR
ncbi:hypothetical protein [[Phormidium] sp. ETS-05]|uniref:hypothetical protein n=1 Tax=[Phormidium] sp. ETS-05 TaxID=222819 RepID=UPI0018EF0BFF|nr:hypothetical protein [[Phormidium] sp. ETS-05]